VKKKSARGSDDIIRVLYIDVEPYQLKFAKLFLEEADPALQVELVSSPEAALRMLEEPFDCIVSDYQMWGLDVIEIYEKLRERSLAPLILYTGRGSEEVAEAAFAAGVDDYVRKEIEPSHYQVLAKRIRMAVGKHRAEERLRASEEKLRRVIDSSPDAIIVVNLTGKIIDCNQASLDMFGFYAKEEFIGKVVFELIAPEDRESSMENLGKTLEQGITRNREYNLMTKDGHKFIGEVSASVIQDSSGKPTSFVVILKDITERKKAEKEIRLLSFIAQQAPEGIAVAGMDGKIVFANRAWAELHGYELREMIGEYVSIFYNRPERGRSLEENVRSKGSMRVRIGHVKKD